MVQFEKQDEIGPKLRLVGDTADERYRYAVEEVQLNKTAQWFRAIRILQCFAMDDDDLGLCAQRMLEVMDRE